MSNVHQMIRTPPPVRFDEEDKIVPRRIIPIDQTRVMDVNTCWFVSPQSPNDPRGPIVPIESFLEPYEKQKVHLELLSHEQFHRFFRGCWRQI
jgi:hypothetical protein